MKRFAKAALITAGILFTAGIIILLICGIYTDKSPAQNIASGIRSGLYHADGHSSHHSLDNSYPVYSGHHTDNSAATASDITELYLDLGNTSFTLAPSQDNFFHITSEGTGEYQYYTIGSAFYIDGFYDRTVAFQTNKLTLEVPDMCFRLVNIDLGAGTAALASIKSDTVVISVGAGEITLDGADCEYLEADIGAGVANINNAEAISADLEVGMGELAWAGSISADLDAEVSMGSITLALTCSQYEHNYELECDMGNITLGQRDYGGIAFETKLDNGADSTYSLECDMGSITVNFND